jgi:hypothetical protein
LVVKTLDPDSLEMLDPDPYPDPHSGNPDPQESRYKVQNLRNSSFFLRLEKVKITNFDKLFLVCG